MPATMTSAAFMSSPRQCTPASASARIRGPARAALGRPGGPLRDHYPWPRYSRRSLKRLVERLEQRDAALEEHVVVWRRQLQALDHAGNGWGIRGGEATVLEIEVVHDLGDPTHRRVVHA